MHHACKVPGFSPLFATEGVFGTRARGVFAFTTARISRRFNLADLVADTTAENAFFKVMANRETRFFRIFDRVHNCTFFLLPHQVFASLSAAIQCESCL